MSVLFEGVLVAVCLENFLSIVAQVSSPLRLKIERVDDISTFVYIDENRRSDLWFSSEMEYVAGQISTKLSQALLVRYDDRVGYRETILFQDGLPSRSFNSSDEVWVMIDELGKPIVDGEKFTVEQIKDDDNEYETIENAIQLGLNALGVNNWNKVISFITGSL